MIRISQANFIDFTSSDIQRAFELMVYAYAQTEKEIWGENYVRLELEEFKELIKKGEVYIAQIDGVVVGSIHSFPINENDYSFSLLNSDFSMSGKGVGSALISKAEELAKAHQAKNIKIEILRPADFKTEAKIKLDEWYSKLGYQLVNSCSFLELKPDKIEKAEKLIVPAIFDCYLKRLQ